MGKKGHGKADKKKLTKKEKKQQNHLKLVHGKKGNSGEDWQKSNDENLKKSA